jgi:peptidylprolyl isomerase
VLPRLLTAALLLVLAAALGACGDNLKSSESTFSNDDAAQSATSTDATTTTPKSPQAQAPKAARIKGDTNLAKKPKVPKGTGAAPTTLKVGDIVVGKGPAAKAGDQLTVQYVGVLFKTGKQFDASWDSGQPFPFQLGTGGVIPGWDQGLVGMRVGGRRQLTIPSDLAYGPQGTPDGSIPPNSPLIFIIDLKSIG